jgi:hypothetical protein
MILRTQDRIKDDITALMRNTGGRWTDAEIYLALNLSTALWSNVHIPLVYSMPNGWDRSTFSYTLPSYVRPPLIPQARVASASGETRWFDLRAYQWEPSNTLRFTMGPPTGEGRVLYYVRNGSVPTTMATLATMLGYSNDYLMLPKDEDPEIGEVGWIKIEDEYIQYAGLDRHDDGRLMLTNLTRGVYNSQAKNHNGLTPMHFCVAVDDDRLWMQLYDQMRVFLHEMFLTDASPRERDHHERQVSFYQQRAERFWENYVPAYAPQMVLGWEGTAVC